jgi:hypothetical protein
LGRKKLLFKLSLGANVISSRKSVFLKQLGHFTNANLFKCLHKTHHLITKCGFIIVGIVAVVAAEG